jgi:integrase
MLREHLTKYGMTGLQWIFPGEAENPLHQNSVGYLWRKACRLAGVEGVRYHDLRHFFASNLIAAGCDVVTVQKALGHSSANTTLWTYAHWFPRSEDRTRSAAQAMIDRICGLSADRDLGKAA